MPRDVAIDPQHGAKAARVAQAQRDILKHQIDVIVRQGGTVARNEAQHLPKCFKSLEPLTGLPWTDTLIILDSRADEATERVARDIADRVVVSEFVSFPVQRNKGLDLARGEWVFFIDPDERCTPALAREITGALDREDCAAFRVACCASPLRPAQARAASPEPCSATPRQGWSSCSE